MLAKELGVSKSPIREALHELASEGFVYTVPFRGCFVASISDEDIKKVFQVRQALDVFCGKQACEAFSNESIEKLKEILMNAETALG